MAVRRRRRGALEVPTQVGYLIEGETKKSFDTVARNADMSSSELIELVIQRVLTNDITDQGIPSWLPEKDRSGELPINTD